MAINQTQKLADLRSDDEWLLVLYDALRYDTFDHYMGETAVQPTISPETGTDLWMETVWPDTYDVCYVSGSPLTGDHNVSTYNAADHFEEIVEVWKDHWDRELRTVEPGPITDSAIDALERHDKVVVHYVQPHAPYIGNEQLIGREVGEDTLHPYPEDEAENTGVLFELRDKFRNGELSLDTLRRAYYDNLVRVVEGSRPLISAADRRTVISSDHGECLGEHRIGHNHNCVHVRKVPWYEPQ